MNVIAITELFDIKVYQQWINYYCSTKTSIVKPITHITTNIFSISMHQGCLAEWILSKQ